MKIHIQFKDPDAISDIIDDRLPYPDDAGDITPNMEIAREKFSSNYFEYWDYGVIEIDSKTLECRLLPRKEWR
jgi:hypothetical protein